MVQSRRHAVIRIEIPIDRHPAKLAQPLVALVDVFADLARDNVTHIIGGAVLTVQTLASSRLYLRRITPVRPRIPLPARATTATTFAVSPSGSMLKRRFRVTCTACSTPRLSHRQGTWAAVNWLPAIRACSLHTHTSFWKKNQGDVRPPMPEAAFWRACGVPPPPLWSSCGV